MRGFAIGRGLRQLSEAAGRAKILFYFQILVDGYPQVPQERATASGTTGCQANNLKKFRQAACFRQASEKVLNHNSFVDFASCDRCGIELARHQIH
jgi:hypothetical protein